MIQELVKKLEFAFACPYCANALEVRRSWVSDCFFDHFNSQRIIDDSLYQNRPSLEDLPP